jgi:hypothetical protein
VKVLVGNAVTTGHHAKAMSPDYLLSKKERKKAIKNEITKKNKRHEWAWKELHP